jgi:hypothetical protein
MILNNLFDFLGFNVCWFDLVLPVFGSISGEFLLKNAYSLFNKFYAMMSLKNV